MSQHNEYIIAFNPDTNGYLTKRDILLTFSFVCFPITYVALAMERLCYFMHVKGT